MESNVFDKPDTLPNHISNENLNENVLDSIVIKAACFKVKHVFLTVKLNTIIGWIQNSLQHTRGYFYTSHTK
jgi:hypothetical protein